MWPLLFVAVTAKLFAIGDLHGDAHNALRCLQLCNLTDAEWRWTGGEATLVQMGDVVDRGPDSIQLLHLLMRLRAQAAAAGGQVVQLLGNHEVMAFKGRVVYTHKKELGHCGGGRNRTALFAPDGPFAYLRQLDSVAVLDHTAFVHAGLTLSLLRSSLPQLNAQVRLHIQHSRWRHPLLTDNGVHWSRELISGALKGGKCGLVRAVLDRLNQQSNTTVLRIVVGHTIQPAITLLCNDTLIAIDVAISSYMTMGSDNIGAVVFENGRVRVLGIVNRTAAVAAPKRKVAFQTPPELRPTSVMQLLLPLPLGVIFVIFALNLKRRVRLRA
eukprot:NODE_3031_length_1043_cov_11.677948_g2889_i0.p1 GENE.NODE_3031_length_1043_cov_11.677948_g2889_i0~~NODE_3031_length_1043_cov_11.677948_g2889_i0.p1  ORF type:complete len:327 (-),score=64.17 NODE_3031_length_1043_cov_11.677948_g2889_i0:42-1022(-)